MTCVGVASYNKNPNYLYYLRKVLLLITGKSGNCLHSINIISNETRIFAQSCQGRWIFFIDFELEQALFDKNLPS